MKCQIENIKDAIAKEYGFNSWDQYFEYFITTKPGRKVLETASEKYFGKFFFCRMIYCHAQNAF